MHVSIALIQTMEEFAQATTHDDAEEDDEDGPGPSEHAATAAHARAFRGDPTLELQYLRTTADPYADDGTLRIHADARGVEYWYDPARDRLVHAGPGPGGDPTPPTTRPDDRLPVAELRAIAETYVRREIPDFPARKPTLHPLEDNLRRELYFFRWDDLSRPYAESEMPPFVQICVRADGAFHSFSNALKG